MRFFAASVILLTLRMHGDAQSAGYAIGQKATNSLAGFKVRKGFRVELAASDPMVSAPAAMAFDENGRLFVCEMKDRGLPRDQSPHLGRVRVLEDTDGDGVFDASTVYADDLAWPSAIACYSGGVFVAAAANILYLKDSRHDGIADLRSVALTGFGGTNSLNPERLLHSFIWGPDNRVHCGTAGIGGRVNYPGATTTEAVPIDSSDFAFDARTLHVFAETGPSMSAQSIDALGRRILSDPTHPLRWVTFERRYLARNPFYPRLPALVNVAGAVRPAGPIPDARACLVYRGALFPAAYRGSVFVADATARVIYCRGLQDDDLSVMATRRSEDAAGEFLTSADPSFRPTQVVTGPEGALYIADLEDGGDHGRILRVVPDGIHASGLPRLAKARALDLVTLLASANGWESDTAARLLYERQDRTAVPLLSNMVTRAKGPLTRIHALHVLDGQNALSEPVIAACLADSDEHLREQAVLLSEKMIQQRRISDSLWGRLWPLAADPSLRVRYQLALTLGEFRRPGRVQTLAQILWRDLANPWTRAAVMSSLADGAGEMFAAIAGDARFRNDPVGREFITQLATMIGVQGRLDEVTQAIEFIDRAGLEPQPTFAWLATLGEALARTRSSLALVDKPSRLQRFYTQALNASVDAAVFNTIRVEAVRLLGVAPFTYTDVGDLLFLMVGSVEPQEIQSATINTLLRYSDARVAANLLGRWQALSAPLRSQALAGLLERNERVPAVLAAFENGTIRREDAPEELVNFLRSHRDPAISRRALALFGPTPVERPEVVERYKTALRLKGDSRHGGEIFKARCAACHGKGRASEITGPILANAAARDKVLSAILEPNRAVRPDYRPYVVATQSGETMIGLVNNDLPEAIVLTQRDGVRTVWPVTNIASIDAQPWSWMPVGLEEGLAPQDMADLVEFVSGAPK